MFAKALWLCCSLEIAKCHVDTVPINSFLCFIIWNADFRTFISDSAALHHRFCYFSCFNGLCITALFLNPQDRFVNWVRLPIFPKEQPTTVTPTTCSQIWKSRWWFFIPCSVCQFFLSCHIYKLMFETLSPNSELMSCRFKRLIGSGDLAEHIVVLQ